MRAQQAIDVYSFIINLLFIHYDDNIVTKKVPGTLLSSGLLLKRRRPPTLPHCIAVPSAQAGLTSLFGMGRGGTPPQ